MLNSHNIQEMNIYPSSGLESDLFSPYPGKKKGRHINTCILQMICKGTKTRFWIGYKGETASLCVIKSIDHL
jgi:hypothetical protein